MVLQSTRQYDKCAGCVGENSYSHHSDMQVGVSVIDRFTYYTQQFFSDINLDSNVTMSRWRDELTFDRLHSTVITECVPAQLH
jgi:glycosylphosphatidylinositol transamidase (GPIT) subunit GPI8